MTIKELTKQLEKNLSKHRFKHCLSVARFAARLGKLYGWAPEKAYRAGLLHDWAKEWTPRELIRYVKKNQLHVPDVEFIVKTNPNVLHGFVGAADLKKRGWLKDPVSLKAIETHTMGNLKMSREDKILFIADGASPDRRYRKLKKIRRLARRDLQLGFAEVAAWKMRSHLKKHHAIHPFAVAVWNANVVKTW
jgi:predicted HD superfamily hydrolase involved in NAD metabolism